MAINSKTLVKRLALSFIAIAAVGSSILAEPLKKQMNFSVSADYRLRMAGYALPAGDYILYQINDNNTNLFALYQNDMTSSPIAMVETTRIEYPNDWPQKTKMHYQIDDASGLAMPTITGWQVAGMNGWEIISVVPKGRGIKILTRVR